MVFEFAKLTLIDLYYKLSRKLQGQYQLNVYTNTLDLPIVPFLTGLL